MREIKSLVSVLSLTALLCAGVRLENDSRGGEGTLLSFALDTYQIDTVNVNGEQYSVVTADGLSGKHTENGAPELPLKTVNVMVGVDDPSIEIVSIKYKSVSVLPVLPSKGNFTRNINPETVPVIKGDIYTKDQWYPANVCTLSPVYTVRNTQGVTVQISPFLYNASTGILKIAEEIRFVVHGANKTRSNNSESSKEFQQLLKERFINASSTQSRYTPVEDGEKMIVIVAEKLKEQVAPFVTWKNQKGIQTTVYSFPSETGGDDTTALKKFIKDKYDSEKITYVMLVGDADEIPSPMVAVDDKEMVPDLDSIVPADPIYGMVSGNDLYADLFVGRIPAQTGDEVTTMLQKVITYEKSPKADASWYAKEVSIGSNEGTPKDYDWLQDSIQVPLKSYGFSCDLIKEGDGKTPQDVAKLINEGRSIVNFMGHGDYAGFGFSSGFWFDTTVVKSLTNGEKLPVVIPLACNFGQFKDREGPTEYWLQKEDGGAVAIVGSTPLMDWTPPQYAQVEMNRLISKEEHNSFGAYFYNGSMAMLDQNVGQGTKTAKTWVYFGDPSLQLFTKAPKSMTVTKDRERFSNGSNTVTFETEEGARITLTKGDEVIASKVATSGSASFTFDASEGEKITITVVKRNRVPNIEVVEVSNTAVLANSFSQKQLAATALRSDQMQLSIPQKGAYSIALLSVNGRVLHSGTYSLSQGNQRISLQNNLAHGTVVIARIKSGTTSIVKRMLVQ